MIDLAHKHLPPLNLPGGYSPVKPILSNTFLMITFKVLKMSPSKKSAFCSAIIKEGVISFELAVGYVKVSEELPIGTEVNTKFKSVTTRETHSDSGDVCTWLVPAL